MFKEKDVGRSLFELKGRRLGSAPFIYVRHVATGVTRADLPPRAASSPSRHPPSTDCRPNSRSGAYPIFDLDKLLPAVGSDLSPTFAPRCDGMWGEASVGALVFFGP